MELHSFFKSMAEQDLCAIVICNLEHEIIYMNPAAKERYVKWGGAALLGQNLLKCHNQTSVHRIEKAVEWFLESPGHNRIHTFYNEKENKDGYIVALRQEDGELIGYYEKHEYRNRETAPFYMGIDEE